jgi:hypothetical protein
VSAVNIHSIINLFRNGWNDLSPRQYVVKKDNVSRRSGIDPQIHLHPAIVKEDSVSRLSNSVCTPVEFTY